MKGIRTLCHDSQTGLKANFSRMSGWAISIVCLTRLQIWRHNDMLTEIAPGSSKRCAIRAVSIARLALGYKTGLPNDNCHTLQRVWPRELCWLFCEAFPDRQIIVLAQDWFRQHAWPMPGNILYWANINPDQICPIPLKLEDAYLWIFGYSLIGRKGEGHIVIGCPLKACPDMSIYVVFGIKI